MSNAIEALNERLSKQERQNGLRSLTTLSGFDFCSNDYLGFSKSQRLRERIDDTLAQRSISNNGSTGSRLLSGNTELAEKLEEHIAAFHETEAALLFNSGYCANLGIFSCIANRHDTILYDELSHASIIDGIRLSHGNAYKFSHNNLVDLESKLAKAQGNIFIVVESVYSMDGDFAPLVEVSELAQQYNANLIVDEAHATGIFESEGRGLIAAKQLRHNIFASIHTFGKALGVHGAVILGSNSLRRYLINFARSFIYTTSMPAHSLIAIECAYEEMKKAHLERIKLFSLIEHFTSVATAHEINVPKGNSPIQSIIIPGNDTVMKSATHLRKNGFDVLAIRNPTVPKGKERLRICLHSYNTEDEIDTLCKLLQAIPKKS